MAWCKKINIPSVPQAENTRQPLYETVNKAMKWSEMKWNYLKKKKTGLFVLMWVNNSVVGYVFELNNNLILLRSV
jgi:hypothetical protein